MFPRTKSPRQNVLIYYGAIARIRRRARVSTRPVKRLQKVRAATPSGQRPGNWLRLLNFKALSRNGIVRADHPDLVIGEFHRNVHHLDSLHVAGDAVLSRNWAGPSGMICGGLRADRIHMTTHASLVVACRHALQRSMRVVARHARQARVTFPPTATVLQTVWRGSGVMLFR